MMMMMMIIIIIIIIVVVIITALTIGICPFSDIKNMVQHSKI